MAYDRRGAMARSGLGGSVLWWEAGEGWVRHGQVLGGGKEGDREGVLENNGRGR